MIGCIIQARMGSNRLPGKSLMKIDRHGTVLEYVINQIRSSIFIDEIIVATTTKDEDEPIVKIAKNLKIKFFRGSSHNVLDRYYQCAKSFSLNTIVRITADNPFIDPEILDQMIQEFFSNRYDYVTNTIERTYPHGTEVEIFSFNTLERIWLNAKLPSDLEHVTSYIRNQKNKFKTLIVKNQKDLSKYRWTLDRKNDLVLIRTLAREIKVRPIHMLDILKIFKEKPDLININKDNLSEEGYLLSLKKDKNYQKKKKFKI